jgi:hypothetical protein
MGRVSEKFLHSDKCQNVLRLVSIWWYEREQKELQGNMENKVKEGADENRKEQKYSAFGF